MQEDQTDTKDIPVSSISQDEVACLLRDVGIPIKKELGEGHVGPEDREGEGEFAHNMEVLLGDNLLEVTGFLKKKRG